MVVSGSLRVLTSGALLKIYLRIRWSGASARPCTGPADLEVIHMDHIHTHFRKHSKKASCIGCMYETFQTCNLGKYDTPAEMFWIVVKQAC